MATATREKRCRVCGKDVSQAKRTKDATGNYYCEPCVKAARSGQRAGAATISPRSCANCGKLFGALETGTEWQGHRVCMTCAGALEAEESRRVEAAATAAAVEAEQVQQQQQAQAASDATLERTRTARQKALRLAIISGVVGVVWLFIVLPVGLCLLGAMGFNIAKYRRLNASLARGEGTPGAAVTGASPKVVIPVLAVVFFVAIALGLAFGVYTFTWLNPLVFKHDTDFSWLVRMMCWLIGGIIGGIVGLRICAAYEQSRCPNCGQYSVAEVRGAEHVGTQVGTYNKTERVYTKALDGTILSTTDVPVQRSEVTETYREYCVCRNCGNEWPRLRSLTRR